MTKELSSTSSIFDRVAQERSRPLQSALYPVNKVGALVMVQWMVRGAWWELLGVDWLRNVPGFRQAWVDWEKKRREGEVAWEGIREWLVREDSGGWGSSFEGVGFVEERLEKKRRVLVVCGAEESIGGGRVGVMVADGLADGLGEEKVEVVVVEGAGHFLLEDYPAKVGKIIKKWLEEI